MAGTLKMVSDQQKKSIVETFNQAATLQMESMLSKIESKDIHEKLEKLMKSFNENDSILKEKFDEFLKGSPDLKINQSEDDKEQQ